MQSLRGCRWNIQRGSTRGGAERSAGRRVTGAAFAAATRLANCCMESGDGFGHEGLQVVDGDAQVQVLPPGDDGRCDADDLAAVVEDGTPRGAGRDGRGDLKHRRAVVDGADGAHEAVRHSVVSRPERVPDRDDGISRPQGAATPCPSASTGSAMRFNATRSATSVGLVRGQNLDDRELHSLSVSVTTTCRAAADVDATWQVGRDPPVGPYDEAGAERVLRADRDDGGHVAWRCDLGGCHASRVKVTCWRGYADWLSGGGSR